MIVQVAIPNLIILTDLAAFLNKKASISLSIKVYIDYFNRDDLNVNISLLTTVYSP